jgi:hypothetical protein
LAEKLIESLNVGQDRFIFSINLGPESAMIAGPCPDEIKPIQLLSFLISLGKFLLDVCLQPFLVLQLPLTFSGSSKIFMG